MFCQFLWERKAQTFDISNFSNKFKHKIVNFFIRNAVNKVKQPQPFVTKFPFWSRKLP